jgi:DNA repair exonuclease SbcCD ATPase subunit
MFKQMKSKENELQKIKDELHELQVKYAGMLRLSHRDPTWSEAKAHNLGLDVAKLQEKEAKCLEALAEIKNSEAFRKEIDESAALLEKANKRLQTDQKNAEERLQQLRYAIAEKILEGGDPYGLAAEIKSVKETIEIRRNGLEAISQAFSLLVRMGESVPVREKIEVIDQHFTPTPAGPRERPQYQS